MSKTPSRGESVRYQPAAGATLVTRRPAFQAAMRRLLDVWPDSVQFNELLKAALDNPGGEPPPDQEQAKLALGQDLLQAYSANMIELQLSPRRFSVIPGEQPCTTPLARRQAELARPITSIRHQNVTLNDFSRYLLLLLNGERDQDELVDALTTQVISGVFHLKREDKLVSDRDQIVSLISAGVPELLSGLGKMGLLVR